MRYYDISRSFIPGMATWPGDSATECEQVSSIAKGASVNVSRFTTSTHTGTHVDAPFHYNNFGAAIDELAIDPFWGLVQVISVDKESGPICPSDLPDVDLTVAQRLILATACSHLEYNRFPENIAYPSVELVDYISEKGIILFGTDTPSVDALEDPVLPVHKAFLEKGIAIIEGLSLKDVPDGLYQLAAIPIKIRGADGAPCRAVLRSI
jgi:arylformamidase